MTTVTYSAQPTCTTYTARSTYTGRTRAGAVKILVQLIRPTQTLHIIALRLVIPVDRQPIAVICIQGAHIRMGNIDIILTSQ